MIACICYQHLVTREGVLIMLDDGVAAAAAANAEQPVAATPDIDGVAPTQPRPLVRAEEERVLAVNPNYVLD